MYIISVKADNFIVSLCHTMVKIDNAHLQSKSKLDSVKCAH
jgi:hypothetical protein